MKKVDTIQLKISEAYGNYTMKRSGSVWGVRGSHLMQEIVVKYTGEGLGLPC